MRNNFIALLILLCCTFSLASVAQSKPSGPPPSEFERMLMACEQGFIGAAKKGDAAFFKRTLADDFSFVSFDGQLYSRQEMIDQFATGGFDLMPYEMKVVQADPETAIVTYNVVLRVPPSQDEGPPPRYQHFSTVWVKQGDIWKMKFQQMTASHWGDW
ncbi:MAG TPA: nuclear transport factor 2 family protein [Candidatus Sulfotelmatobacter sp.]|nr:nuclear transport factor 2 family protein [Candidatus Sulfotelmatobacter sp.]